MSVQGWQYYNHAMIPLCAPHEEPNLTPVENGQIWRSVRGGGMPLLARWTSDWDCGQETAWWFTILDRPFDISQLKSKRRSEINKGLRNFDVVALDPRQYAQDFCRIAAAAYETYPIAYRPTFNKDSFLSFLNLAAETRVTYGAFSKETGELAAFSWLCDYGKYLDFETLKCDPVYERQSASAALIFRIVSDFNCRFENGFYIYDGERNILHQTAFPEYLEKYFGFRKAYCRMHIKYAPAVKPIVLALYPFRKLFRNGGRIWGKVKAVLFMEEISRECNRGR